MTTATTIAVGRLPGKPQATLVEIPGALRDFAVGVKSGTVYESCGRCSPTWSGSVTHYMGIYDGVCFECGGRGYTRTYPSVADAEKALARRAKAREAAARRRERKAAAEREAKAAEYVAWRTEHPDLAAALEALAEEILADEAAANGLGALYDFAFRAKRQEPLTERQAAFAEVLLTERAEDLAAEAARKAAERYAGEVGDTVTVTGTVVKALYIEPQNYGWSGSMLIVLAGTGADVGITVKTFTGARWASEVEEGEEITLTGTVKAHETYEGVAQTALTRPRKVT